MRLLFTITTACVFFVSSLKAQIITSTLTPTQYVQNVLLGGGVTASNVTFTGLPRMIASFTAPAITNLGLNRGVYLTTGSNGKISTEQGADGPSSLFQSVDQNQPGDASLDLLTTAGTQDAAILEFDFIPQSDTVKFRYVFGSEEYNEFVNTTYNDVFAFILSGISTTLVPTNIALIPGSTTPITINNVNNGNSNGASTGPCSNCTYYRDNDGGSIDCVYDGLTIVLTAKKKVICGETYHIKIAIADAGDGAYDSGVFLEAGSFSSVPPLNVYTINSNSNIPDSVLVEGCNTYCAYFIRNGNISNVDSFNLQIAGNALLGTDYIQSGNPGFTWPNILVFAANQDTIKICNIIALQDNVTEGSDTLKFEMSSFATSSVSCLASNSIKFNLYIKDYIPISIGQNNVTICSGASTILNAGAGFGYPAYTYTLSSPSVNTPTLNTGPINSTTVFTITVNDICNNPVTKQITVTPVAIPTVTVNDTILCYGNSGILTASGASTYSWNSGPITVSITVTPTVTTNYTVVGSVGTCTNSAVSTVTVIGQVISISGINTICNGQSTTLTASGGSSYNWDNGATTNTIIVTPTNATTYTVTSVAASCTNMAVYTVSVVPIPTVSVTGSISCPGQNNVLIASGASSYVWSTGSTISSTVVNPTTNATYTVIGTVASCTNMAVYTVTVIPTPSISVNNGTICIGDSVVLSPSGGSSYTWSTGSFSSSITVSPATTTNYTVVGTVGSCTSMAVATVSVASPAVSVSGNNNICIGQSSVLSASGGSVYSWNTGAGTPAITVTPTVNTSYTVSTIIASCTNTAIFTVSVTPKPIINVVGTTICPGQNGTITATGAITYTWSTGANTGFINVNPIVNTTYTVTGTTIPACTDTAVYTVNVITSQPDLQSITPNIFCLDSIGKIRVLITNGNPPYFVSWLIPGNGIIPFDTINNVYYFTQSGNSSNENYTIIAVDQCLFSDTITVNIQTVDCDISIPNVVTVNGDGVNDYFRINGLENFPGSVLMAFNRWGNKIYSSDDYKNDWKPEMNSGTYFYILNIKDGRKFNGFFQVFKD
ncbi:MAG: choice-of-anchor L domain-containing protein [Burkholderiales bacterium]|nr:choice-of-anchor L domain-containing protein [Bacteroidia bacterium]